MIGTSVDFVSGTTLTTEDWFNDMDARLYGEITTVPSNSPGTLWADTNLWVNWTGTGTLTNANIPAAPQAGAIRYLRCDGASKFTAHANLLIQGITAGSDYTATANDIVEILALTTATFLLTIKKYSGVHTGNVAFPATQVPSADVNTLDDYEEGTFTLTGTGFTTSPTTTVRYIKVGSQITLSSATAVSGTSNAAAKGMTGLPAQLIPSATVQGGFLFAQDNGTGGYLGRIVVLVTTGNLAFDIINPTTAWTTTGAASLGIFTFSYAL